MAKITTEECDAMFAGIINFAHGIEKFMRVAEEYYIQKEMDSLYEDKVKELFMKNLIKGMSRTMAYSMAQREAEEAIRTITKTELEERGPLPYKEFLQKVREVVDMVESFTDSGLVNNKLGEENMATVYDYMMGDADRLCRVFCRFSNIEDKDDNAERAIKRYETRGLLSEEFMDKWFRTQGIEPEKPKRKRKKKEEK